MEKQSGTSCLSCGAAMDADDVVCDLCGTPRDADWDELEPATAGATEQVVPPAADTPPVCAACGHVAEVGARFCSACGTPIKPSAPRPGGRKTKKEAAQTVPLQPPPGRQLGILVVSTLLLVTAAFLITRVSKTRFPTETEAPAETRATADAAVPPLSGDMAEQVAALEDELAGLQGDARLAKYDELLTALSAAGRLDRVALLRETLAGEVNTQDAWIAAGEALYAWMETIQTEERMDIAQRAATAYEQALTVGPDNLIARTAMAMSYMNTRAPMQGVMQIRQVLETDPNHLEGNFYYGVMLMQISRIEQATAQFEKVKTLVGPEHPLYRQADLMLTNIRTLGQPAGS